MKVPDPFTFEAFQTLLAGVLKIDAGELRPEAYFITDLGVDSLRLLSMLLSLEEMGFRASLDTLWRIQTVGDAYRVCLEQINSKGLQDL
jgi:acyl carrier protein